MWHRLSVAGVTGGSMLRQPPCCPELFTQEADWHRQGRKKVQLFCGLRSALTSDGGRNVQTIENNQGEVALQMKINSEGFFIHM